MGSSPLRIIDAQIHVWKANTPDRPWPADAIEPQREVPLEVPEVSDLMDEAGVSGALLLAPTWDGGRNDYPLEVSRADPARWGTLMRWRINDRAEAEKLADWRSIEGMRGIRLSLNRNVGFGDTTQMIVDAISSGFFAGAEKHGVPLSIYAPGRYDDYAALAAQFPGLKITVDHCAIETTDLPLREAVEPLMRLAAYPNITIKASALPCFVSEGYPFPSITQSVYALVEAFGADRVFWGSDLSRLPVPYKQLVDTFVEHTPELSDDERALVMGGALASWLDWPDVADVTDVAATSVP